MSLSRSAAVVVALAAATGVQAQQEWRDPWGSGDIFLSRWTEARKVFVGGRLGVRPGPFTLGASLEAAESSPLAQPELEAVLLVGAGLTRGLGKRLSAHVIAVGGSCVFQIRDYVDGGFMSVGEPAIGARAGVELRLSPGTAYATPTLGLSVTALRVSRGSDELRGIAWGGPMASAAITLGLELRRPRAAWRTAVP